MKHLGKILAGFLAGATAGLLFAPKDGKKFRHELGKSSSKMSDFGKALLAASKDASTEVQKLLASDEAQALLQKGKVAAEDLLAVAKEKGEKMTESAQKELKVLQKRAEKFGAEAKKKVKSAVKKK